MRCSSLFAAASVLLLIPGVCRAFPRGTFTIQEDNDVFALSDRSDRGYTNGTRITWTWEENAPSFALDLAGRLCGTGDCQRTVSVSIGQNMYTPENLRESGRIAGDRPYGGWLYGELSLDAKKGKRVDHLSLYLGAVGRGSYAKEAQIFAHKYIVPSAPEPQGWDNQVGDFPGFVVACERQLQFWELRDTSHRPYLDLIPSVGGMIGNVFAHGSVGATLRIGYNLPDRFLQISTSVPGVQSGRGPSGNVTSRLDGYLFATAEARFVAHDVFLDASDREHRIRREPFVRDRRIGASLRYKWARIQYIHHLRSSEFAPDSRSHSYGTYILRLGVNP